jgi:DNA primase small subunit
LLLFKQRIITDKKNTDLMSLFTFKDHSLSDHQTKMILETQLVDDALLKSSETLLFRVRLFGHPNDRGVGFLSGMPKSRFVYMKDSDLQLEDIDSNNAKHFALSREEFCHLLLSDTTSHSNAKKRSLKIVSSLNEQKIVKTPLSNAVTPLYKYYDNVYPFEMIWKMFGHPFREINYVGANAGWIRNLHFKSVEQFKESVLKMLPVVIHFGAIYDRNLKDESKVVVSKELIFDVDLNDYCLKKKEVGMPGEFNLRMCCGSDPKACSKCWKLAIFAARFLSLVLVKMLGFRSDDIKYVFSGRRGMHCIVSDKRACSLSANERTDLLNFFSKEGATRFYFPIINELYKRFAAPLLEVYLNEQEPSLKKAFFNHVEQRKRKKVTFALEISTLELFWPRFDAGVTKQLGHPFKSPYIKHPETQNVCEFFDPFSDYDPFQKKK